MKMLAGILSGIGPRFTGFLASPLSGKLFLGAMLLCGVLFGLWRMEAAQTRKAYAKIGVHEANAARYEHALANAKHTIGLLADAAEQNRQAAIMAVTRAELAEGAMYIMRDAAAKRSAEVDQDAEAIRQGDAGECRRLTDPLPESFVGWVFNPADGGD